MSDDRVNVAERVENGRGWVPPTDTEVGRRLHELVERLAGLHPTPDLNQQGAEELPACRLRLVGGDYDDLVRRPARAGTVEPLSFEPPTVEELREIHAREPALELATEAAERATRRAAYRNAYRRHIRTAIHAGMSAAAALDRRLGDHH